MKVVIVLPTYNEKENIPLMLKALIIQSQVVKAKLGFNLNVLVVDDNSPDGTALIVKRFVKKYPKKIFLLSGTKNGLGKAYLRGFSHAINNLGADAVMEMDADFSHDPKDIVRLLKRLSLNTDFVIGSRYIKGGSIPKEWSLLRRMNSKFGNIFARYIAGINGVHDCTAGFRAIRVSLLNQIDLDDLKVDGYSFQMNLLYSCLKVNARISEVPVHFTDRIYGESKIALKDIIEFVQNAFLLRINSLRVFKAPFFNYSH